MQQDLGDISGETMDKKNQRTSSIPPKAGNHAESKKSDNGSSRNTGRYNNYAKRKNGGGSAKPQGPSNARRPTPQKSRDFNDKRPKTRGYQGDRQRQEVTSVDWAEPGSALRPGSKKNNLNHLLNFSFAPRGADHNSPGQGRGNYGWKGRNRRSGRDGPGLKFNKERFLQANCQFVVKETGDYLTHSSDPDSLVDWDLIEQVRLKSNEVPSCPICLYPPTAAKITRCGHIFCWTCMLHYLSLGDKTWRKCPICYEAVHEKDIKSVVAQETHTYAVGQEIKMKLMKRERGSTYAMTMNQWSQRDGKPHSISDDVDLCYVKLLLADPEQVLDIVQCEQTALEVQLVENNGEDSLETSYIHAALDLIKERNKSLHLAKEIKADVKCIDTNYCSLEDGKIPSESLSSDENAVVYASAFDDEIMTGTALGLINENNDLQEEQGQRVNDLQDQSPEQDAVSRNAVSTPDSQDEKEPVFILESQIGEGPGQTLLQESEKTMTSKPSGKTDVYYFYQASDGQHIYLHSVNARCLLMEYGTWEQCPDEINARIVDIEGITMSEELRKRLRYLSHLPLTCEFKVAELALQPPVVSQDTLNHFIADIDKLKQLRNRKIREEKRRTKKIQVAEDRQNGLYPDLQVSLENRRHFPEYSLTQSFSDSLTPSAASAGHVNSSASLSSTPTISPYGSPLDGLNPHAMEFIPGQAMNTSVSPPASGLSFAKMLQKGSPRRSETWPSLSKMDDQAHKGASAVRDYIEDSDNEDRVPVPVFQNSFSDAIQNAFDKMAVEDKHENPANQAQSGGKKKKGKKLLFTTSIPRCK